MVISLLAAALLLQPSPADAPAAPSPLPEPRVTLDTLSTGQSASARCAIAFAAVSRWQKAGDARGAAYPDIEAAGGREFFVRVMASLMDDADLTREQIADLSISGVEDYDGPEGEARIAAIMPACELMKAAAGL
jgi:hypothetical protein